MTRHDSCQVSPFGHPGITARLTAPPGLSRPPTSFIGSWCQGIHRSPLTTSPQKTRCSRPLCTSQPTTKPRPTMKTPALTNSRYAFGILPGIEDQPRGFPHNGCSFRYPTGCYVLTLPISRTGSLFRRGLPRVLGSPAVANEKLASVSAFEHPTTTFGWCGLLTPFGV